ncbi:MAG: Uma2 family endonuclease [Cyanobacteria bacterium P01_A01_bin.114]
MKTPLQLPTDTWVTASWDDFLQVQADPAYEKAKLYYFEEQILIEMNAAVGPNHARDNAVIPLVISLFCIAKGLAQNSLVNCNFEKTGARGCQPDLAYYIGSNTANTPTGSSIVNLNSQAAPDLAIEIADTSVIDDLGKKRMLYESLNIPEYWVVDVKKAEVIIFAIADSGSRRLEASLVLPGLTVATLDAALKKSRTSDQTALGQWLMAQFQQSFQ